MIFYWNRILVIEFFFYGRCESIEIAVDFFRLFSMKRSEKHSIQPQKIR